MPPKKGGGRDFSQVVCRRCNKKGHFGNQCTEGGPNNSSAATGSTNPKGNRRNPTEILIGDHCASGNCLDLLDEQFHWTTVPGILDSGSDRTVGYMSLHKKFCGTIVKCATPMFVRLGDSTTTYPITAIGDGFARVSVDKGDPVHLGKIRIYLVDVPGWKNFYIGREVLVRMGATPEQALAKLTAEERQRHAPRMD